MKERFLGFFKSIRKMKPKKKPKKKPAPKPEPNPKKRRKKKRGLWSWFVGLTKRKKVKKKKRELKPKAPVKRKSGMEEFAREALKLKKPKKKLKPKLKPKIKLKVKKKPKKKAVPKLKPKEVMPETETEIIKPVKEKPEAPAPAKKPKETSLPKAEKGAEGETVLRFPGKLELVMGEEKEDVDQQIKKTKGLMKRVEKSFFARELTEVQFRKLMFDYQQKLFELQERKKMLAGRKKGKKKKGESIRMVLRQKAGPRVDETRLLELERNINTLVDRYSIPEREMIKSLKSLGSSKLAENLERLVESIAAEKEAKVAKPELTVNLAKDLQRLVKAIESERASTRKSKAAVKEKEEVEEAEEAEPERVIGPAPKLETAMAGDISRKKFKGVEKKVEGYTIETEFDKVLSLVKKSGQVKMGQAQKTLHMDKQKIKEVADVLEDNGLIKVIFPPLGDAILQDVNFLRQAGIGEQPDDQRALVHHRHRPVAEFQGMVGFGVREGHLFHLEHRLAGQAIEWACAQEEEAPYFPVAPDLLG